MTDEQDSNSNTLKNSISNNPLAKQVLGKNVLVAVDNVAITEGLQTSYTFHKVTAAEAELFINEYQVAALEKGMVNIKGEHIYSLASEMIIADIDIVNTEGVHVHTHSADVSIEDIQGKIAITVDQALKFNSAEKLYCLDKFGTSSLMACEQAEMISDYCHTAVSTLQDYTCILTGLLCSAPSASTDNPDLNN